MLADRACCLLSLVIGLLLFYCNAFTWKSSMPVQRSVPDIGEAR